MLGGDVEREAGGRLVAGPARIAQRRARVDEAAGRVEVRGQVPAGTARVARRLFERRRDASVQADAPAGGQVPDDGLPHERVREGEAVEGAGGADEPRLLGRLERVERRARRRCRSPPRRCRRRTRGPPRPRPSSTSTTPAGRRASRQRTTSRTRGVTAALGGVAFSERANHLPDEERVALGHGSHPRGERRRPPGVAEDGRDVRLGQRSELEPADVRPARQPRHHAGEQRRAARLRVAVGREHEQAHRASARRRCCTSSSDRSSAQWRSSSTSSTGCRLAGRLQQ